MILSLTDTRRLLIRLKHSPKRFLGQNFLVDGNIVKKSLELARIEAGDKVVEIGPGLGTLSSALLHAGAELWAIEKDKTLHAFLADEIEQCFPERFHLMEGDAVKFPLAGIPESMMLSGFKVVANLPYAISTPWMDGILSAPTLPSRMVLMLQLEAAERYAANPSSKQYSAISIFLQAAFNLEAGHKVAAACFYPRPDVDSCLFNLSRKEVPFIFPMESKRVIRCCFQQRRKQLGALLRKSLADGGEKWLALLEEKGFGPKSRPEDIPVELWQRLPAVQSSRKP